jgi:POT family proton-dependent oligopeptide transporter
VLAWGGASFADSNYQVPMIFLALAYMFHTTGELFLSPVGLSAITKLSPVKVVSFMMGGWFLASAAAQYVGGVIAGLTASETVAGQVLDPAAALATYIDVFSLIGWWGVGLGVVFAVLSPWLKRLGHGKAGNIGDEGSLAEAGGPRMDKPAE